MSAFMCSDQHFRVLAAAIVLSGVEWRKGKVKPATTKTEQLDRVAFTLAKENAKSVNYRYAHHKDREKPSSHFFGGKDAPIGDDNMTPKGAVWSVDKILNTHTREMIGVTVQQTGQAVKYYKALDIYKALRCLEYQSCEHPGWTKSEAYRMCEAASAYFAREAIENGLAKEYNAAAWCIYG